MRSFRQKSYAGMFLAVTCVPAVLALTLTLPVVDHSENREGAIALPFGEDEPLEDSDDNYAEDIGEGEEEGNRLVPSDVGEELHHLVESGFSPLRSPLGHYRHSSQLRVSGVDGLGLVSPIEELPETEIDIESKERIDIEDYEDDMRFSKTLTAVQSVLGSLFCTLIIFRKRCQPHDLFLLSNSGGTDYLLWTLLGAGILGLIAGTVVMYLASDGTSSSWRLVRCFAGFVCSMVWIAAIADEVVNVLRVSDSGRLRFMTTRRSRLGAKLSGRLSARF